MGDICLVKVTGRERVGLVPADSDAEEAVGKLGDGEMSLWRLMRVRSIQWHRMYFGICNQIGKNQDPQRSAESVDSEVRVLAGHYEVIHVGKNELAEKLSGLLNRVWKFIPGSVATGLREVLEEMSRGYEVRVPKRIAFDRLTADEWSELWPSLELAIVERFGETYLPESQVA